MHGEAAAREAARVRGREAVRVHAEGPRARDGGRREGRAALARRRRPRGRGHRGGREGSREGEEGLLPALDSARAETEQAVQAVANAADRAPALRLGTAAKDYADRLAASASAAQAASAAELALAREQLGAALSSYRASRATWRFDAPEPQGAERDFAEARRDMERAESAFMSRTRVAPRESGHEFDAAAAPA